VELEVRHLRIVRAIAAIGTTTGAAAEIGVTQSALSQQLLDLEGRLGERLFERTGRRMVPTAFGGQFLDRARGALDEMAHMRAWLLERRHEASAPLRINTDNALTLRWLPRVLARFRELHPNVPLRILRSTDPMRDLAAGRLDLAITYPQVPVDSSIEVLPLFDDELVAVLPREHRLARRRLLTATDLNGENFLYHMELETSVLHRRYLQPAGVQLASVVVIENPEAIIELVRAGLGISLLPRASVAREIDEGAVVAVRVSPSRRGYRIGWSAAVRRVRESPWVDQIVALLRGAGDAG